MITDILLSPISLMLTSNSLNVVLPVMITVARVETGLGHSGQPGHVLSGSTGSDLLYKISGTDPDSALDHVH